MKKDLVLFNPRPKSIYVHLDQLLFDLKYDPSIIEIPVPRYFREEDNIKVELAFKEKVERDTGKKKKIFTGTRFFLALKSVNWSFLRRS